MTFLTKEAKYRVGTEYNEFCKTAEGKAYKNRKAWREANYPYISVKVLFTYGVVAAYGSYEKALKVGFSNIIRNTLTNEKPVSVTNQPNKLAALQAEMMLYQAKQKLAALEVGAAELEVEMTLIKTKQTHLRDSASLI